MNNNDIERLQFQLLGCYAKKHRNLPWRETKDIYKIWISEVMLQQTQVVKVLDYYQKFLIAFPTINPFHKVDLSQILKIWEGLGYYARVRNLHKAAAIIFSDFSGKIPTDYIKFRKLPGVGDYIAAAVMSQALNKPYPVVDGNVKRVLARLFAIDLPINSTVGFKAISDYARKLLEMNKPGDFNQAVMELGAIICCAANPKCADCPIQ